MTWLILTIVSAIAGALTRVLQKILLTDEHSNPVAFAFVFQLLVAGMFLSYSLLSKTLEIPNLYALIPNLIITSLFYCVGNLFIFHAFKKAEASEVSIIFATSAIWSAVSAVLFLNETLDLTKVVGILTVFAGVVVTTMKKSRWFLSLGHIYALLGALLFGLAFTNDAFILGSFNSVSSYMILAFSLPAVTSILIKPRAIIEVGHFLKIKTLLKVFLCGVFYALSAVAVFTAYKIGGKASIVSSIQQTSIIFTVLMGYVFLGEKDNLKNKVIGVLLAFGGVILLI
ncbi:MAG: hypothetical protein UW42_C0050G0002 [Candidatus Collierbacteria bacterium GW2011_GWB1_44_197]|nr:MAG: hypothetical protein UW42_C0050G0002 [Candidatus Collierbacteria bacterium GW2011_GWB1_44_197]